MKKITKEKVIITPNPPAGSGQDSGDKIASIISEEVAAEENAQSPKVQNGQNPDIEETESLR